MKIVLLFLLSLIVFIKATPTPLVISTPQKYTQNFNTLSKDDGTTQAFSQGVTLPSWWSNQDTYIVSDGSNNAGGLYSFGLKGSGDRALGAITSNKKKTVIFGFTFTSPADITDIEISFWGEQWRYGGLDTSSLAFDYSHMTYDEYQNGGWGVNGVTTQWKSVPSLSFMPLVNSTVGPTNDTSKIYLTVTLHEKIMKDTVVQLRWTAKNSNDGLAIDDLEIILGTTTNLPGNDNPSPVNWMKIAIAAICLFLVTLFGFIAVGVLFVRARRSTGYRELAQPINVENGNNPNNSLGVYGALTTTPDIYQSSNRN